MKTRTRLVQAGVLAFSTTVVAIYIGCRSTAKAPESTDNSPQQTTPVFSGSKSEVITPAAQPEFFSGSKSAQVLSPKPAPPQPPLQAKPDK